MQDYLDFLASQPLLLYDRFLSSLIRGLPEERALAALREKFLPLFADWDVQDCAERLVDEMTRDFEANLNRNHIRKAWAEHQLGLSLPSTWSTMVAEVLSTRRLRWERLARQLQMSVPDGFIAYRGVGGMRFVQAIVDVWENELEDITVVQHELASWSLVKASAQRFANDPHASVVYTAHIPFAQTFLDKWVDGGRFIKPYANQYEIIAGAPHPNGIVAKAKLCDICYKNRWYRYENRHEIFLLLRHR
jgi:hypothetical protein